IGITDGVRKRTVAGRDHAIQLLLSGAIKGYLWNKIFRRDLLPHDPFPAISTQEDLVAVAHFLPRVRKIVLLPDRLYHHVRRDGSLTNTRNPELDNIKIGYQAVREAAASLDETRRKRVLLSHHDVVYH